LQLIIHSNVKLIDRWETN